MIKPASSSANYTPAVYRELLDRIGFVLSFTHGVSMRPLIFSGLGYVTITKASTSAGEEYQVGDVLLFEQIRGSETACILHRLIAIEGSGNKAVYVTRGDNCLVCERIRREDIIGRASMIHWASKGVNRLSPRLWLPHRMGAEKCAEGLQISVDAPGYLRYVEQWNKLWPLRRIYYRLRASKPYRVIYYLFHPVKAWRRAKKI